MDEKNPQALSKAYKSVVRMLSLAKEYGITADMTDEAKDAVIEKLSDLKEAQDDSGSVSRKDIEKGQEYYVNYIIELLKLPDMKARLNHEYDQLFADVATEDEMIRALEAMA